MKPPVDHRAMMPDFPWERLEDIHQSIMRDFEPRGAMEKALTAWELKHLHAGLLVKDQSYVDHGRNLIGALEGKRHIPRAAYLAMTNLQARAEQMRSAGEAFLTALEQGDAPTRDALLPSITRIQASLDQLIVLAREVIPSLPVESSWVQRYQHPPSDNDRQPGI